jgi:hypothetical protein
MIKLFHRSVIHLLHENKQQNLKLKLSLKLNLYENQIFALIYFLFICERRVNIFAFKAYQIFDFSYTKCNLRENNSKF